MEQMNMLPSGMMAQGQPSMQRPQAGNPNQQVHAQIMLALKSKLPMFAGSWQATCDIRERAIKVLQIYTQLCMIENNSNKCFSTAISYEHETISRSQSKDQYQQQIARKLNDINNRRQQSASNFNAAMGTSSRTNMPGVSAPPGGPMNINMNGMPNPMQQPNMMQNSHQPAIMDPSALNSIPMQQQMSSNGNRPRMNMTPNPNQMQQPTQEMIQKHAQATFQSLPEDRKQQMRSGVFRSMTEQQRQQFQASGKDPLVTFLLNRSRGELMGRQANQIGQQNLQMGNGQESMGGAQGNPFDFSAIMGQQANALKLQESGEQVVPASNNANNPSFNAQMNTPNPQAGGINPAALRNNHGNNGQTPNPSAGPDIGQIMLEREKARQTQQRNIQAQQQAMLGIQNLNGQPGGLNAPNGLPGVGQGSPMPMLNRPMQPPGGQPPSTPNQPNRAPNMQQPNQPNQQPGQPQNVNANAMLQQHHQKMLNRNNAAVNMPGGPPNMPLLDPSILQRMPPAAQERIRSMQPQEVQGLFQQMAQRRAQAPNMRDMNMMGNNGNMNPMPDLQQPMQMGQGNPMQMPPNINPAQLQGRGPSQHQGMPGQQALPPGYNNVDINQVPPPLKNQIMFSRPLPPHIPQSLGIVVPPQMRFWGQLKQHIEENVDTLPTGTRDRMLNAMIQWFNANPDDIKQGLQQYLLAKHQSQARSNQNNIPQMNGNMNTPVNPIMPNAGQGAPTAQMVPGPNPQAPPGLPANQGQRQLPHPGAPVSQDERVMFRRRFTQFSNADDNQTESLIRQYRVRQLQAHTAQQQSQMAQGGRPGQPGRVGPQPQPQPQRTPMPNAAGQQIPPMQQPNGQKRAQPQNNANDDVMEIPNPNASVNGVAPQAPKMRPSSSQQQPPPSNNAGGEQASQHPNQGDIERMKAIRAANLTAGAANAMSRPTMPDASQKPSMPGGTSFMLPTEPEMSRINAMMEDARASVVKGPPVHVDQAAKATAAGLLKRLYRPFNDVDKTFAVALRLGFEEKRIQQVMRAKILVFFNWDDKNDRIKEPLSITMHQLQQIHHLIQTYLNEMKTTKDKAVERNRQAQEALKTQKPAAAKQTPNQPATEQPLALKHSRKASSNKVPTAPTDNKHFDWAAPSPHGVPNYHAGRTDLTPDKLKFPSNKRRRTGQDSTVSTPVGQVVTPGAPGASPNTAALAKTSSPEQMRKSQAAAEEPAKRFKCTQDPACTAAVQGLETEAELKAHVEAEHKIIEDPMKFFLDSAAQALGVDAATGQPLPAKAGPKRAPANATAQALKSEMSNTPGIKTEVRTPASGVAATPSFGSKPLPKDKKDVKTKTLAESMADKMGFPPPAPDSKSLVELPDADADADESFMRDLEAAVTNTSTGDLFTDFFDTFGQPELPDQPSFTEDWGFDLPPAALAAEGLHDSPSDRSDTTQNSSRGSDVSASDRLMINLSWDAFGGSDKDAAGVFPGFGDLGLGGVGADAGESKEKSGGVGEAGAITDGGDFDWSGDFSLGEGGFSAFTKEDFAASGDGGMEFDFGT